jgi:hypothetical protein
VHALLSQRTYLEIGVRDGDSLSLGASGLTPHSR